MTLHLLASKPNADDVIIVRNWTSHQYHIYIDMSHTVTRRGTTLRLFGLLRWLFGGKGGRLASTAHWYPLSPSNVDSDT